MFKKLLGHDLLYIQIYPDRFVLNNTRNKKKLDVIRPKDSLSPRMLIADFTVAHQQLKEAVKSIKWGHRRPHILFHPIESPELLGGLTQIEFRALGELAISVGAQKVAIYQGDILDEMKVAQAFTSFDDEIFRLVNGKTSG